MLCPRKRVYFSITLLQDYEANRRNGLPCEFLPNLRVVFHHDTVVETPLRLFLCQQKTHVLGFNHYGFYIGSIKVLAIPFFVFDQHLDLQASIFGADYLQSNQT